MGCIKISNRIYLRFYSTQDNRRHAEQVLDQFYLKIGRVDVPRAVDAMLEAIRSDPKFPMLRDASFHGNKILYTGLAVITGQLAETAGVEIPQYIQFGTSTQALSPSDTACITPIVDAGGLSEQIADTTSRITTNQANDTLQLELSATSSSFTGTINEAAIRTSTPTGFARLLVSPGKPIAATETVDATYKAIFQTS